MWNKLIAIAGLSVSLAACATSASRPSPVSQANADQPPAGCVADTATRLPMTPHQCAAFGQRVSGDDLRSTGQTDVAQGLRQLDPSVQTGGPP